MPLIYTYMHFFFPRILTSLLFHLDTSSSINCHDGKNNVNIDQSSTIVSEFLSDEKCINEDTTMKTQQGFILSPPKCNKETITTVNNDINQYQQLNINN